MRKNKKTILVSGATSFVGTFIINKLKNNFHIITIGRKVLNRYQNIYYDIDKFYLDFKKLKKIQKKNKIFAFINLAYSRNFNTVEDSINFNAKLLKALIKLINRPCRIINISTISANINSIYGNTKKEIEHLVSKENGYNIRCGLIYTNIKLGGILGKITSFSNFFKIIILPYFAKTNVQYLTNIYQLVKIIFLILNRLKENRSSNRNLIVCDIKGLNIKEILDKFNSRPILLFYINNHLFIWILKIINLIPFVNFITEDNLIGLRDSKINFNSYDQAYSKK